jgi:photosystem II stability/assembly factor-like uncharacterized protein
LVTERYNKSVDGGTSWQVKMTNIGLVQAIVFDPRNPNWAYAATEGSGILRTTDGGETWYGYDKDIFYPLNYSLAISQYDPSSLVTGSYGSGLYWLTP